MTKVRLKYFPLERARICLEPEIVAVLDEMLAVMTPREHQYVDVRFNRAGAAVSHGMWHFDTRVVPGEPSEIAIWADGCQEDMTHFMKCDTSIVEGMTNLLEVHRTLEQHCRESWQIKPREIYQFTHADPHRGPLKLREDRLFVRLINIDRELKGKRIK